MEEILLYALKWNVLAAAVIVCALALSAFINQKYSVLWRSRLWLIVALLLLCPVPFPAAEHAFQIAVPDEIVLEEGRKEAAEVQGEEKITETSLPSASKVPAGPRQGKISAEAEKTTERTVELGWIFRWMAVIWAAGVLTVFIFRAAGYRLVKKELKRWSTAEPNKELILKYRKLCREMGIGHPPELCLNQKLTTPLLSGLIHPEIYLPSEQFTQREMELLLEHELCHYRRKDLWYQLVMQAVCTVYWWNPLLWVMKGQAQKEAEFLCDEMVTGNKKKDERMQYNYLLARTAVRSREFYGMSTGFSKDLSALKERMVNVMRNGSKKKGSILTVCFAVVLILANIMTGCSVKDKEETDGKSTSPAVSVSGKSDPEQEPLSTEPVETEEPEMTVTPAPAESEEPEVTSEPTKTPEPTEEPDSPETQQPAEESDPTETPEPSEEPESTPEPEEEGPTAVQAKINVYEGEYRQDSINQAGDDLEGGGYIVKITNVTDTSFDFSIYLYHYERESLQEPGDVSEDLVFKKHTAIFVEDGETAVYDGKDYDLTFTFPNIQRTYPEAVEMQISGFTPVEGANFVNNNVPGYEFG